MQLFKIAISQASFIIFILYFPAMTISIVGQNFFAPGLTFPDKLSRNPLNPRTRFFGPIHDSITISADTLRRNADQSGISKVVFLTYQQLHEILADADVHLTDKKQEVSKDWVLNSKVISASFSVGKHVQLENPLQITLKHLDQNLSNPICVFWNFEYNSWSNSGCRVKETSNFETTCECDHLTIFALLMRSDGTEIAQTGNGIALIVFQIISYVALAIVICVILFLAFKVTSLKKITEINQRSVVCMYRRLQLQVFRITLFLILVPCQNC